MGFGSEFLKLHYPVACLVSRTLDLPPIAVQIAEQERLTVRTVLYLTNFADRKFFSARLKGAASLRECLRRRHRDGEALQDSQVFAALLRNFEADNIPGIRRMLDVMWLGGDDMSDDVHAETFLVKLDRRSPVVAFDGAVGERLRNVTSSGKLLVG